MTLTVLKAFLEFARYVVLFVSMCAQA